MDARIEGGVGAAQGVGRGGADQVGEAHEAPRFEGGEREQRGHRLRAVDQRQAFLGLQDEGREAGAREPFGARHLDAAGAHPSLAEERQRQVGERGEVAARPHRAAARHDRQHLLVEQREQGLDHLRPHARVAAGQGVGAQQEHAAHRGVAQRLPHSGGVREEEPLLEECQLVVGDAHPRQVAEAGVDAVDRLAARDRPLDRGAPGRHPLARRRRQRARVAGQGHRAELVQGETRAVDLDHESHGSIASDVQNARHGGRALRAVYP